MQRPATRRNLTGLSLAVAGALALALGAPAEAELTPWDQPRVTVLSQELASGMRALKQSARKEPVVQDGLRARDPVITRWADALDGLEKSTRQLAARLSAGADREATLPLAKRIRMHVRDAEREGRKIMTGPWTQEKIVPVVERLDALSPYYFDGGS